MGRQALRVSARNVDFILSAWRGRHQRLFCNEVTWYGLRKKKSLWLFSKCLHYSTPLIAPDSLKITAPITGTGLYSW